MEIQAAITREKGLFSVETAELDEPQDHEVLVKVLACGMCHTDLSMLDQQVEFAMPAPSLLGHEGAGVVEKIGAKVTGLSVGDKVLMSFGFCGECSTCSVGQPAYCEQFLAYNFSGVRPDGSCTVHAQGAPVSASFFYQSSFANYALTHANNIVKVDADAPLEILAPLGCGIQTGAGAVLNALKPTADDTIAIFGLGAVGLSAVMAAKISGCRQIIAVDLDASRLELAVAVGATHGINGGQQNVVETIHELIPGGVDYVVEATGVSAVISQCVESLGPMGTAILLGVQAAGAKMELDGGAFMPAKTIRGCVEGESNPPEFIPQLIAYYQQGLLPIDKLIKTYPLSDINQAVTDCKSGATVKPVLLFDA